MVKMRGFEGLHVISFESRRAEAMEKLIQKHGGIPCVVPSMREIPLEENPEALRFAEKLFADKIDILILTTAVGTRTLIEVIKTKYPLEKIKAYFQKITLVARGPKPVAALGEIKLRPNLTVPEPNTWHEILTVLDQNSLISSKQIAIQEYGIPNQKLISELEKRGAQVFAVPVYRWTLPENIEPLKETIRAIADRKVEVILWTNAQQVVHALQIARQIKKEDPFRQGMNRALIASIGPTCSETLRQNDIRVDFEPVHPKMANLVSELAEKAHELLHKRT